MLGILENSADLQFPNKTVLVWSLKDRNEYGFTEKLQAFKEKLPDFRLVPFFANESAFSMKEKSIRYSRTMKSDTRQPSTCCVDHRHS